MDSCQPIGSTLAPLWPVIPQASPARPSGSVSNHSGCATDFRFYGHASSLHPFGSPGLFLSFRLHHCPCSFRLHLGMPLSLFPLRSREPAVPSRPCSTAVLPLVPTSNGSTSFVHPPGFTLHFHQSSIIALPPSVSGSSLYRLLYGSFLHLHGGSLCQPPDQQ